MADKPRKKKKRKKKNYLLRLLVIIAVGVGLYFLLTSEIFDIAKVKVENNSYYTVEQVKEKAGVKIGQNIFEFKKSGIKKKLLKDPYFENVVIKRRLPSTIIIDVVERTERAAIPRAGGSYTIIDPNGLVLRQTDIEPKITWIQGMTVKKAQAGSPLEVEETSMLTDTLNMLKDIEDSDLFFKKIDISNVIIRIYIYDQLICEGTPENLAESIQNGNLETILYEMYSKGIERGVIKIGSDNYYSFDPSVE